MKPDDFFEEEPQHAEDWVPRPTLRENLLDDARRGPIRGVDDLSLGLAITELAHREFEAFGTDGSTSLSEDQTRLILRTLKAVLARLGIPVDFPWRDFSTFKTYWLEQGCYGSWQARRDLLNRHFDPIEARLYQLEERAYLDELAEAVSPHNATGWRRVDDEVAELRRRFRGATTPQDCRAIGTHCVGVLEALSRTVYDPALHLRDGEEEPPVDKTKQRLGRYIETAVPGRANENIRGLATKTIALAHEVKHSETPTRREAGIAADAAILLANMLRRLAESEITDRGSIKG